MPSYVIIGSETRVNADLERLLDGHCVTFARYPGRRVMETLVQTCAAVFVTATPADDSIAIVTSVSAHYPELPIICVGALWSCGEQMRALASGARAYLASPIVPSCLADQLLRSGCTSVIRIGATGR